MCVHLVFVSVWLCPYVDWVMFSVRVKDLGYVSFRYADLRFFNYEFGEKLVIWKYVSGGGVGVYLQGKFIIIHPEYFPHSKWNPIF